MQKPSLSKLIAEKFRHSQYPSVREWHQAVRCPLHEYSCTRIIYKGKEPSLSAALVILHLLGTSNVELIQICKDQGDKVFCRLIAPCDVTAEERTMVQALRENPAKAKVVRSLLAV